MPMFAVGLRYSDTRYVYITKAKNRNAALDKVCRRQKIKRDPYNRDWVFQIKKNKANYICKYPIPNPFVR